MRLLSCQDRQSCEDGNSVNFLWKPSPAKRKLEWFRIKLSSHILVVSREPSPNKFILSRFNPSIAMKRLKRYFLWPEFQFCCSFFFHHEDRLGNSYKGLLVFSYRNNCPSLLFRSGKRKYFISIFSKISLSYDLRDYRNRQEDL